MPQRFEVILSNKAQADLREIGDTRTYRALTRKIDALELEPDKQGKQLGKDLTDYRAVRAAGQRYRVVYQVGMLEGVVTVVVVGIRREGDRKDVYRVARKHLERVEDGYYVLTSINPGYKPIWTKEIRIYEIVVEIRQRRKVINGNHS